MTFILAFYSSDDSWKVLDENSVPPKNSSNHLPQFLQKWNCFPVGRVFNPSFQLVKMIFGKLRSNKAWPVFLFEYSCVLSGVRIVKMVYYRLCRKKGVSQWPDCKNDLLQVVQEAALLYEFSCELSNIQIMKMIYHKLCRKKGIFLYESSCVPLKISESENDLPQVVQE